MVQVLILALVVALALALVEVVALVVVVVVAMVVRAQRHPRWDLLSYCAPP